MSFTSICHILYFTVKYVIYIHSSIQICEVSWCYSRPTPVLECAYCSNFCKDCKKTGILSRISYKIPPHVLVNLYYSLIYPYLTSGVVGRERGERRSRTFFQGGNTIPQYFAAFLAFFNTICYK